MSEVRTRQALVEVRCLKSANSGWNAGELRPRSSKLELDVSRHGPSNKDGSGVMCDSNEARATFKEKSRAIEAKSAKHFGEKPEV